MASTDARPVPRKNTAFRAYFPILDADGDLVTGAASLDSEVSIDGGTFTDCTSEATEIATSSGCYYLDLTSGEMNGDAVVVIIKTGTAGAKTTTLVFYPEESGDYRADVTHFGGTAGTFSGGRPEVNASHIAGSAVSTTSAQIGVNVVQISTDATAADNAEAFFDGTGYAGTGNTIPTVTTVNGLANNVVTAAAIADGAIDRATFAADTGLQSIRSNTAQAGAATTITLDASASATNDFYKGAIVFLTGATGAGQYRLITGYVGATKVATVTPAWATNPDNTSTFAIMPHGMVGLEAILGVAVSTSTAQLGVNVINFGGSAGTFASGRPEVNTTHIAGSAVSTASAQIGVNVVSMATDSMTSTALAASAVTEIQSGLATAAAVTSVASDVTAIKAKTDNLPSDPADASDIASSFSTVNTTLSTIAGYIDTEVAAIKAKTDQLTFSTALRVDCQVFGMENNTVTAAAIAADAIGSSELAATAVAEIADQVWEEAIADHSGTAGSTAAALAGASAPSAATVADAVWDEARSDHVGAGTFGQGVASVQGNVTGSVASVTGNVGGSVGSVTASVTVGTNNDKTGYRLSATGVDDVWDEAQSGHATAGTFGKYLNVEVDSRLATAGYTSPPAAATIAGLVWDEARSSHTTSGSFGQGVASVQGNVTGNLAGSIGSLGAGAISAGTFAGNAIDASALAADAVAEIQSGIVSGVLTTTMTESYAADGAEMTMAQALFMIWSFLAEKNVSGTALTTKKLNGSTTAMTFLLDSANTPSTITRTG